MQPPCTNVNGAQLQCHRGSTYVAVDATRPICTRVRIRLVIRSHSVLTVVRQFDFVKIDIPGVVCPEGKVHGLSRFCQASLFVSGDVHRRVCHADCRHLNMDTTPA